MLEALSDFAVWKALGAIIWVNLLLSGDNAAAIIMRVILTVFAVALLQLPWLKLVGGLLLLWIGVKLLVPESDEEDVDASDNLLQAVKTILIADLVMSLDNG